MTRFKLDVRVEILGTEWRVRISTEEEDPRLKDCDGYTDKTTHEIGVQDMPEHCSLGNPLAYIKKVIRHEVIHAFLFESGLTENWEHKEIGHEETTVDWMAVQLPKIQKVLDKIDREIEPQSV